MKKILLAVFVLVSIGMSQSSIVVTPTITDADIINAASLVDPLNEKVKDISPTNFSLLINNITASPQKPVMVTLKFEAYVTLEEDRQRVQIASGYTSNPFLIPPAGRVFTSKDADNGSSDIDVNTTVNEDMKKKLKDKVLDPGSGGRVPSGLYELHLTVSVVSVDGKPVTETPWDKTLSITITNPTTAVLNVPFNNGYIYPTPFPQFQWTYDTRSVILSVYAKRPDQQSLEDAIAASDPYLQIQIDRKLSGNLTSFTYPQSAASRPGVTFIRGPRQLERGKMYVVVLDGVTTAFGYTVDPIRTMRSFVVSDPQGQVIINTLLTTFGGGQFQDIFNSIQSQNLLINTSGITLNGLHINPQDLQRLLTQNKDNIISVRIED